MERELTAAEAVWKCAVKGQAEVKVTLRQKHQIRRFEPHPSRCCSACKRKKVTRQTKALTLSPSASNEGGSGEQRMSTSCSAK